MGKSVKLSSLSGSEIGAIIYFSFTGIYVLLGMNNSDNELKTLHQGFARSFQTILGPLFTTAIVNTNYNSGCYVNLYLQLSGGSCPHKVEPNVAQSLNHNVFICCLSHGGRCVHPK